ncbi:hypothetical protein SOVF_087740 [Spinacia oleracea]|uniref:Uncharacterized protein n=1 Tax=Spinacia oleracea TaxID=3562 RepID=A0A9R0IFY2_SPIOL|nr:uncharacterized protein LOC110787954 [Spinacia oleracea]KNA16608.1 hypothetical protein SOVF_087740 [Spinacia oleracea]
MSRNKKNIKDENDEVEELLRAAEDAALLKMNLNSHTVHPSPSDLHPDLEQRFRDLKSGSKSKAKQESMTRKMPQPQPSQVPKEVEEDDLLSRFAALKASLPRPSPSISCSLMGAETSDKLAGGSLGGEANIDDDEEDEVEKVIRWAMDAARLDPSPSSDDEEIEDDTKSDDDSDDNETSDEDAETSKRNPKGQHK